MTAPPPHSGGPSEPYGPWAPAHSDRPWLRANLHCHTTQSDGRLSPQETVDWFASAGYDVLALTDHNRVTEPDALDARGMCLLRSTELTASGGDLGSSYHLVSLGLPRGAALPAVHSPAPDAVRRLRAAGAAVFVAHPHWSGLTTADVLRAGADGLEVYNGGTVLDSHQGEATVHWDEALARGVPLLGIAVDDTHWHTVDRGLGWVMIRAASQTPEAVTTALARGEFYATAGPQLQDVRIERDGSSVRATVRCSPCAAIYLLGHGGVHLMEFDRDAVAEGTLGATITEATFQFSPPNGCRYVRVQCADWQQRSAWSNPLAV